MKARGYRPLNKSELARKLGLKPKDRSLLRVELVRLEREGAIVSGKKGRFQIVSVRRDMLIGWLHFQRKGHAWFHPDRGAPENSWFDIDAMDRIFVPRRDVGTGLEGDRVRARVVERGRPVGSAGRGGGARGKGRDRGRRGGFEEPSVIARVERVLERRSGRFVGIFQKRKRFSWVEVDEPALRGVVDIDGETTARPGQSVVVTVESWQGRNQSPRGRVVEVLGWPGDPGVEIETIIHRYGIREHFTDEVLAEARAVRESVAESEIARRDDWRERPVVTIDPRDAKDFDDAILVEKRDGGGWRLAVHIADVYHYVKPGSALDGEAEARGNSTYLVDRVLPMLPTELSNGICSLRPDVERLTKAVVMDVDPGGKVGRARFVDAVIRSSARLAYEQAQEMLDGGAEPDGVPPGTGEMLREAWRMASALRKRRFANGALDLEMAEVEVKLDEKGKAVGYEPVEHGPSHQLIEECMLAANEAVARFLKTRGKPAIYRVHEEPDQSKLFEFGETARAHGYKPGDLTNRHHIQKLLDSARGEPDEHSIKLGLLKSLKRAAYSTEPQGHYGLAKTDYCHFTSPIRRYADLVVHRALQPMLENPPKPHDRNPGTERLRQIASHISETERSSSDAERDTKRLKLLEFLSSLTERDGEPVVFAGVITDIRYPGLMVEAVDIATRGMVKREDLPGRDWRFEANLGRFVRRDGKALKIGQKIDLVVSRVDAPQGFVDFKLA